MASQRLLGDFRDGAGHFDACGASADDIVGRTLNHGIEMWTIASLQRRPKCSWNGLTSVPTTPCLRAISEDVDGFHFYDVGGLVVGDTVFPPCTPCGVFSLLDHEGISLE